MDSIIRLPPVWQDRLERWLIPINLRKLVQTQGALDSIFAFSLTVLFFSELARPGTFTSREILIHMPRHELRRYLSFYLWYAVMHLAQLTVSLLVYMDVRNIRCNVDGRRRTIFVFLVFTPTLLVNLLLSAAKVLYFPWAPLGLFYVLHTLYVIAFWGYALRYYKWLGDCETVHFEAPLVGSAAGTAEAVDGVGYSDPPAAQLELQERSVDMFERRVGRTAEAGSAAPYMKMRPEE